MFALSGSQIPTVSCSFYFLQRSLIHVDLKTLARFLVSHCSYTVVFLWSQFTAFFYNLVHRRHLFFSAEESFLVSFSLNVFYVISFGVFYLLCDDKDFNFSSYVSSL